MQISELLQKSGVNDASVFGDDTTSVEGISIDSGSISAGCLFACIPGEKFDGHNYAQQAIEAGASALLVERVLDGNVPQIQVPSVRAILSDVSKAIYGNPQDELRLVAVTGTNGKTTVTYMLKSILESAGHATEVIGTISNQRTTPESPELFRLLRKFVDSKVEFVCMEVSSHALDQGRIDGLSFEISIFTNLSQDHLDYHGNIESYFAAKAELFTPQFTKFALINTDDEYGTRLYGQCEVEKQQFGISDVKVVKETTTSTLLEFEGVAVSIGMPGRHNIYNAIAAGKAARELGLSHDAATSGLSNLSGVPGRMQAISRGQMFNVFVDYAHTPDGLEQVLSSFSRATTGSEKLICVFGCGGDRDKGKRPIMGKIAEKYCNQILITNDNPRSEDPEHIAGEILAGVSDQSKVEVILDRRKAIHSAIVHARDSDTVIIAGKGHETGQTIGDKTLPFDDVHVATEEIDAWLSNSPLGFLGVAVEQEGES